MTTTPILKAPKTPHLRAVDPLEAAPAPSLEPWVGKKQIAAHLNRSTRWVEIAQRERGLPFVKEGEYGTCWYKVSQVDDWMLARAAA